MCFLDIRVTKIVEAYPPHAVLLQKVRKARRQVAALDALPQRIDADVLRLKDSSRCNIWCIFYLSDFAGNITELEDALADLNLDESSLRT